MALNAERAAPRIVAGILLGVSTYYALWGGEYSSFDLLRLDRRQGEEARQLAEARLQVDSLQARAALLEDDSATIEAVARERFGMIRDGELLYRFVTVDSTAKEPPTP